VSLRVLVALRDLAVGTKTEAMHQNTFAKTSEKNSLSIVTEIWSKNFTTAWARITQEIQKKCRSLLILVEWLTNGNFGRIWEEPSRCRDWGKPWKFSVRIAEVQSKIRNQHFSNTSIGHYRYTTYSVYNDVVCVVTSTSTSMAICICNLTIHLQLCLILKYFHTHALVRYHNMYCPFSGVSETDIVFT
jgi:hypothetical protein